MAVKLRLSEIARLVSGQLIGDADITITGVASFDEAGEGDITFVDRPELLQQVERSAASAVIAPPHVKFSRKPLIVTEDPKLAFSKVLELFAPRPSIPVGVHPTAVIGRGVTMGRDVAIGPYVVVEDGVRLGNDVVLYPFVFVGREADVGDGTIVYPHVFIGERVTIGKRCIIHAGAAVGADGFGFVPTDRGYHKVPQIGTVVIEDDVEIGANSTIDRATLSATRIGKGTKIDDQVHVAHNCVIGQNCLLCGQVGIAGSAVIGNNVILAGQAGVSDHVKIGDNITIAAQAGVIGDLTEPGVYSGFPARPHSHQLRVLAMVQKLPELFAQVRELSRQLEELRKLLEQRE